MSDTQKKHSATAVALVAILFPLFIFGSLELICRVFGLDARLRGVTGPQVLEMPTWMLAEAGSRAKAARLSATGQQIDWLDLFESAEGYRVRLVPNVSREITNTFSRIDWDKVHRYRVTTNSLGFRGPEPISPKPKNGYRVLVFGDSSSFGWGVNDQEMYSSVMRSALQERFPDRQVEVLNFAIPGDSSEYGRLVFENFARNYAADVIILGFGANDAKRVPVPHAKQVDQFRSAQTLLKVQSILDRSALVRTLKAGLARLASKLSKPGSNAAVPAVKRKRYRANLSTMIDQGQQAGASEVLVLTLCTPGDYAVVAEEAASAKKATFFNGQRMLIDDLPLIKAGKIYPQMVEQMRAQYPADLQASELNYVSSDGCHPNALGHKLVGEKLAQILSKH